MIYKILHLDTEKSWRGGERQLFLLIEHSDKNKFEHHAACRKNTALESRMIGLGVKVMSLAPVTGVDPIAAFKIRRYVRVNNIDLVHAHTANTVSLAALALLGTNIPFAAHRRVDFHSGANPFSRFKYKKAGGIITVSNAIKKVLVQDGFDASKIAVIYSGVDLSQYDKIKRIDLRSMYKLPQESVIAGMVTALAPHKDIFNFLEAVKIAAESGVNIYGFIVGEGGLKNELQCRRDELGLENKVIFTGFKENPLDWLAGLDIYVISSYLEGLGSTVLDAMAIGVPVIATRTGGIPEMVEHEKTGLLAEPGNPAALAGIIKKAAGSADLRKHISQNAKIKVNDFSIKNTVKLTEKVYEELLSG